ncbi:hypothetical protein ACJMK2_034551 [Sinanodonta woodiana]|uniref:Uncharacterized protein n=1 Tax=Sinanodonta woodiana TaxID=1069815 RepID=A0ABD3WRZ4_SINWO
MGTSRVCTDSLDLKRYFITPTSCPQPSVLPANQDACPVPTLDGVYADSNLHVNNDELNIRAYMITTSFNKRHRLPLIKMFSPERIHPEDKYFGCSTTNLLYCANSRETSCGSLVKQQVMPVCNKDLNNVKQPKCKDMGNEHRLLVSKENTKYWFKDKALNSFEELDDEQNTLCTSKTVEQNGTQDPPSRRKMGINKKSKKISRGKTRKNFADDTSTRSVVGHETHEKGESSCPAALQMKKARTRNQNKDFNTDRTILTDFSTSLNYHDPDHSFIVRCETLTKKTRICIDTIYINNFTGCERFQKKGIVSETKLSSNFSSLRLCELRPNDTTKRPVMGKTAKFASMDSRSLDVLKEIKRKVHVKYGDKKRRRVKTNGILTSAVVCRSKVTNGNLTSTHKSCTTVTDSILKSTVVSSPTRQYGDLNSTAVVSILAMKDKCAVFRFIRMCKKMLRFKKKKKPHKKKELH